MTENKSSKESKKEFDEVESFVGEAPTIAIKGKEYKLRRLGVADVFKLGRIMAIGAAGMGKEVGKIDLMDPGVIVGLLLVSFPYAENPCIEFLASVIDVKIEDLRNPDLFPIDSVLDIMKALMEHEDMKAFFGKLVGLLKTPVLKGFSKKD